MKPRTSFFTIPVVLTCTALGLFVGGCRKSKLAVDEGERLFSVMPEELKVNAISKLPGPVYQSQAKSAIHWQPWTREIFEKAKASNQLVFAVVALPQQPDYIRILQEIERSPELVAKINNSYIPVLIDADSSREVGILTADLCVEIKRDVRSPIFIWLSGSGDPIAWIPGPGTEGQTAIEVFRKSDEMVGRMWSDSPKYVLENSSRDNAARRTRIGLRKNAKVISTDPGGDTLKAIRQLTSLYDPESRTLDGVGGLFPSGAVGLLATAAVHPGVSVELRSKCLETTSGLLDDLLPSAMFDPLDGGLYSGRRGKTWDFPTFLRNCISQSKAAVALFSAYHATGNRAALDAALRVVEFSEKSYQTPEGLFAIGVTAEPEPAKWLWTEEEIKNLLPAEDAAWWIKASGIKSLGNLPFEVDVKREYFRLNSLRMLQTTTQIAADLGISAEAFAPRFENVRRILLDARNAKIGKTQPDLSANAGASFRMVSTYVAAFGATGEERYRTKAEELLKKCRGAFVHEQKLRMFAQDAPPSIGAGRAFLYSLALQSIIDVSTLSDDQEWLVWAEDIATTSAELFTDKDYLKECPDDSRIINLPVTDLVMLFDDSTAGLLSFDEFRMAERGRPLVASFTQLATPLPTYVTKQPVIQTDLLQATLAREFSVTLLTGASLPADLRLAVQRMPARMLQRRDAKPADEVPANAVKIIFKNGDFKVVTRAEELQQAVLPSPSKS